MQLKAPEKHLEVSGDFFCQTTVSKVKYELLHSTAHFITLFLHFTIGRHRCSTKLKGIV